LGGPHSPPTVGVLAPVRTPTSPVGAPALSTRRRSSRTNSSIPRAAWGAWTSPRCIVLRIVGPLALETYRAVHTAGSSSDCLRAVLVVTPRESAVRVAILRAATNSSLGAGSPHAGTASSPSAILAIRLSPLQLVADLRSPFEQRSKCAVSCISKYLPQEATVRSTGLLRACRRDVAS
jgi:hypothetical protein